MFTENYLAYISQNAEQLLIEGFDFTQLHFTALSVLNASLEEKA